MAGTAVKRKSTRTSRYARKVEAPRRRATQRDHWILETLAKLRFATTTQLTRLHFGSRWGANKRLRKLLDSGLIRVWVRSLSEENVYSLDRAGARVLEKSNAGDEWFVPRGLDRNLDHLLAINQVRVSLAVSLPDAGGEIGWWRSDWELRTGVRHQIVPDAFFEVRWEDGVAGTFCLELDNESRSLKKFVAKMLSYARVGALTLSRLPHATVLVVCRDPRQLGRYQEALRSARLGKRVWFAPLEEVERGVLEAIWSSPLDGEKRFLQAITGLPYGREDSGRECALAARG